MNINNIITPKKYSTSKGRLRLIISDEDLLKTKVGGEWRAVVTDLVTGLDYDLSGCACSIPTCFCDSYQTDVRFSKYIKKLGEAMA
jgi:hypothetical protein